MSDPGPLEARLAASAGRAIAPEVQSFAAELAQAADARAVLFYGSNLRTGSLDGVLDFYILTGGARDRGIWPRVSYQERALADGTVLRAKIATMAFATFERAASGRSRDTTIWSRFVQPAAIAWAADNDAQRRVLRCLALAVQTAARLAAALGPERGREAEFWQALFRATYRAEMRVEAPGREDSILAANPAHFDGLLAPALAAQDIAVSQAADMLEPGLPERERARILAWWRHRRRLGKPLNLLRLAKATTTFDGAARYGVWKLERHSGIALEMTPFREKHPILAAPGALLEYRRKKKRAGSH